MRIHIERKLIIKGIVIGLCLLGAITILTMPRTVKEGEVGVVTTWGKLTKIEQKAGIKFVSPYGIGQITKIDVKSRSKNIKIEASSGDQQLIQASVSYTYHVQADRVEWLYKNVGQNYEITLLDDSGIIAECFKTEAVKYKAEEILIKRNLISDDTKNAVNKKLSSYGIIIEMLTTPNVEFSSEYNKAIEEKQVAEQQVKTAKQIKEKSQIEAETKIIEAQGVAKANALLEKSITKNIIELEKIKKWDGKLPSVTGGATPFIDLK